MSFERSLSIAGDFEDIINEEVRATGFLIWRDVSIGTPVDTGRAKGEWRVSLETPNFSETGDLDETPKGQVSGSRSNDALSVIGRARSIKYPTLYISNPLPYISRLNQGWSDQAPSMFVESAIIRVVNRR